ncbi:hypothetical protein Ciccas_011960 [Cichlidogyrus casuarinus]|uniref:Uridylate-specific endoribonuclease n=1 Tax=Cichlidogyrus casuarinus TaxID=1844966 RepID=A0ABD2PRZ4_9PLAT
MLFTQAYRSTIMGRREYKVFLRYIEERGYQRGDTRLFTSCLQMEETEVFAEDPQLLAAFYDPYFEVNGKIERLMEVIRSYELINRIYDLFYQYDLISYNREQFFRNFQRSWFEFFKRSYLRGGRTSGFRHVYCGDVGDSKIGGLHNWMRFYYLEIRGNITNLSVARVHPHKKNIVSLRYRYDQVPKEFGTIYFGLQRAFEMTAMYVAFLRNKNAVYTIGLDRTPVKIQSWGVSWDPSLIASVYFLG